MAERTKKGFVLYIDSRAQIDGLSDEEAGQLLKVIFEYADTGKYTEPESRVASIVFAGIKAQLDRDMERYQEKCAINRKTAIEREEKKRQRMGNNTTVHNRAQSYTDKDKDSDNDKDKDSDNDSERDIFIYQEKKRPRPPKDVTEVVEWLKNKGISCYPEEDGEDFFDYYEAQGWLRGNGQPIVNWQSCCRNYLMRKYNDN